MSTKKQTLVERILAALNLGESGKIQHFVDKQVRNYNREIVALERNIANEKYAQETELTSLKEKLEDAQAAVESAYTDITPANVETNKAQDEFGEIYWSKITSAEKTVESIEKQIQLLEEATQERIKVHQKEIDERKRRLSKIS